MRQLCPPRNECPIDQQVSVDKALAQRRNDEGDPKMAKRIESIAQALGARVVARVPKTGGGAFGAARLGKIITELQESISPSQGKRPGRPTKSTWDRRPKIPMTAETEQRLIALAKKASTPTRRISPMQLAAHLLEDALAELPAE